MRASRLRRSPVPDKSASGRAGRHPGFPVPKGPADRVAGPDREVRDRPFPARHGAIVPEAGGSPQGRGPVEG